MNARFALILICVIAFGCKRNNPDVEDTFDKEVMLKDIASNSIIPAYTLWETAANQLNQAAHEFSAAMTQSNLESLQRAYENAHLTWNECVVYEFGPAADRNLRLTVNTFPTDSAQIESNIENGNYDLDAAQNADAKGFAAIDYMLYMNTDSLLNNPDRAAYIIANTKLIYALAKEVTSAWISFENDFTSNTSSSAGSSIGNLVNEINYEFELLKNARVGIPLGKKTLGETQVEKLEGFYSQKSNEFAISNLKGIRNAFTAGDKIGLDDYLNDIDARKDEELLSEAILSLMNEIESGLNSTDLRSNIDNSPENLEPLYNKIEQLVVLLKTDMPSQLGVQITYQDNDGD